MLNPSQEARSVKSSNLRGEWNQLSIRKVISDSKILRIFTKWSSRISANLNWSKARISQLFLELRVSANPQQLTICSGRNLSGRRPKTKLNHTSMRRKESMSLKVTQKLQRLVQNKWNPKQKRSASIPYTAKLIRQNKFSCAIPRDC